MIEEVILYRTRDGKCFSDKNNALSHTNDLNYEKKIDLVTKKVKQIFKQDLTLYKDTIKEYEICLESDFWDDKNTTLIDKTQIYITIKSFHNYTLLVKTLLEDFHLKKVIKAIKTTL